MVVPKHELEPLLRQLIVDWENEVVEFKNVGDSFSTSDIGRYFSALSNEANLRKLSTGWLVFGVDNKSRSVVDSDYRRERARLDGLKHQIAEDTEPSITFREIHELITAEGRVVMFEIPSAPDGIPIAWKGHYYARAGESLDALPIDKQEEIRSQSRNTDWTARTIPNATIAHLDEKALTIARSNFLRKYENRLDPKEFQAWSHEVFLDRSRLRVEGKLTRAALLLLGKAESAHLLSPHPCQITWKLEGAEKAYEHFSMPFLTATTLVYSRLRNVQIRVLPNDSLLPVEVSKYDQRIVLEALHNCIAHQDYAQGARILVTEKIDRVMFESEGAFYEGTPSEYVFGHKTPKRYRNPCLAQAMAELNMIDTMGYGIHEMYLGQRKRYFPLPDYQDTDVSRVCLTLYGNVIDPAYTRLLIQFTDLPLHEILALDRVQKRLPIDTKVATQLKRKKLIEGRAPNLHVSAEVAEVTATRHDYIKTRGQDDEFYEKLILDFITRYGQATRHDIDSLLWNKLSDLLDDERKYHRIRNLLTKLREDGKIENVGGRKYSLWTLPKHS